MKELLAAGLATIIALGAIVVALRGLDLIEPRYKLQDRYEPKNESVPSSTEEPSR